MCIEARRWITLEIHDRDPWRSITLVALAGLAAAGAMATFGLPPVDLHGLLHYVGIMDPLCGGTRSVRYAAMGEWSTSLAYNPLGVPLVVGATALITRAAFGMTTQRWPTLHLHLGAVGRRRAELATGIAFVALGINQQLNVAMLT